MVRVSTTSINIPGLCGLLILRNFFQSSLKVLMILLNVAVHNYWIVKCFCYWNFNVLMGVMWSEGLSFLISSPRLLNDVIALVRSDLSCRSLVTLLTQWCLLSAYLIHISEQYVGVDRISQRIWLIGAVCLFTVDVFTVSFGRYLFNSESFLVTQLL